MGFNSVYRTLQELFPQVDSRILKAAAIEHPKDPDQAVESILTEVLPYMTKQLDASTSCNKLESSQSGKLDRHLPFEAVKSNGESITQIVGSTSGSSAKQGSIAGDDNNESQELTDCHRLGASCVNGTLHDSSGSTFYDAKDNEDQLNVTTGSDEFISSKLCKESTAGQGTSLNSVSLTTSEEYTHGDHDRGSGNNEGEESIASQKDRMLGGVLDVNVIPYVLLNSAVVNDKDDDTCLNNGLSVCLDNFSESDVELLCHSSHSVDCGKNVDLTLMEDQELESLDCDIQAEVVNGVPVLDCGNPVSSGCDAAALNKEITVHDTVDGEGSRVGSMVVTRSGHICSINLLEDIIEDAKTHKKTLFLAMESVIGLMRGVELQENAAAEAKEAAARGGEEILARVEDLKKMLGHAKEANDMHAGEVYGEKAILATEMKELQSRLLGLSDERDKSLSILDEMRHALEGRLAAAEEEMKAAEREKLEKEEYARTALADQELKMDKVVQESKILQQQAEENAKLRDFLMDRGHVVDMLQGEISVICQDVKLLKENFDNHIPLSRSFSSKETSCLLASSSSSQKSKVSDKASEPVESCESPKRMNRTYSIDSATSRSSSAQEGVRTPQRDLLDEDWELFDDDAKSNASSLCWQIKENKQSVDFLLH
ncbi:hypothetical protein Ancab_019435 [Ancistrocladus abbreviatus]